MLKETSDLEIDAVQGGTAARPSILKRVDTAIRRALCAKWDHKFHVGSGGYYPGLPQNRCWRCGRLLDTPENRIRKMPEYAEPQGGWLR